MHARGKGSRMLRRRSNVVFVVMCAALVAFALAAGPAHAEVATETELPPVVVEGGGGGAANAPAPGAQPAAPGAVGEFPQVDVGAANPADVAADAAGVDPDAAVEEVEVAVDDVIAPVEVEATPQVVAPAIVDGGGTDGAAAGAGAPDVAGPPAATPTGNLPFTGLAETILLVSLAGMFVPIGVLLYCAARRGDLQALRRQLSMPRFQWADVRERPFHHPARHRAQDTPLRWPGA